MVTSTRLHRHEIGRRLHQPFLVKPLIFNRLTIRVIPRLLSERSLIIEWL